jgi:hypothetical protein
MADVQGPQPVPVEIGDTYTPLDPRAQAWANAQAHAEDLPSGGSTGRHPH